MLDGENNLEFLANDLSIHGQFPDVSAFRDAIWRVMDIRQVVRQFGREVYCHRNLAYAKVTATASMPQVIQAFTRDEQRALMVWLTRHGPFWEDSRVHASDDYLECKGNVVTDSAVGEAAYCHFQGLDRHLVSLSPSLWEVTPVAVEWILDTGERKTVDVPNHWERATAHAVLEAAPTPLTSWANLETTCIARCTKLIFLPEAFSYLLGYPFSSGAAQRILVRLVTLNRLRACFDNRGQRTPEGHRLYQDHFTGEKAWFSDSSAGEKQRFQKDLTFRHPARHGQSIVCTWHGKVKSPQLRIHFTWPIAADEPLYVAYIGPKITKR